MNEVQTTQKGQVPAQYTPPQDAVLRTDILVPYVVLAQASSDSVKERKAQIGDIIRSTTMEKLGDPESPLEVIFLHNPKTNWIIEQKEGNRFKYRRTEPRNASNETAEWNFWADHEGREVPAGTPGATEWRRVKQLQVFAILPRDIEAAEAEMAKVEKGELPDPSKALTPVILSFRSMSYKAGKEIVTFFSQAKSMKVDIFRYVVKLGCTMEQGEDGSYYVWNVDRNKPSPVSKERLGTVSEWASIINQGAANLAVDESAEEQSYANPQEKPVSQSAKAEVC